MKVLALIKRRNDLSRDAFRAHYEEIHAPLAVRTVLSGTQRYVRLHLRDVVHGSPGFDAVSAFWYPDAAAAQALFARLGGPEAEAIRRDELRFMDKAANTFFGVSEHSVRGREVPGAPFKVVALVRRPEGAAADAFVAAYEADWLPRLLDAVKAPVFCLQNRALPGGAPGPRFDCVTQLHAAGDAAFAAWARELAAHAAELVAAAVSEHESALPGAGA